MKISSKWWNFHHWQHQKLSFWHFHFCVLHIHYSDCFTLSPSILSHYWHGSKMCTTLDPGACSFIPLVTTSTTTREIDTYISLGGFIMSCLLTFRVTFWYIEIIIYGIGVHIILVESIDDSHCKDKKLSCPFYLIMGNTILLRQHLYVEITQVTQIKTLLVKLFYSERQSTVFDFKMYHLIHLICFLTYL